VKKLITILLLIIILPINTKALIDSSTSSIVMDIDSGRILYQKNSNQEMLIASTTKIMTFLVALTYASDRLYENVVVGEDAQIGADPAVVGNEGWGITVVGDSLTVGSKAKIGAKKMITEDVKENECI